MAFFKGLGKTEKKLRKANKQANAPSPEEKQRQARVAKIRRLRGVVGTARKIEGARDKAKEGIKTGVRNTSQAGGKAIYAGGKAVYAGGKFVVSGYGFNEHQKKVRSRRIKNMKKTLRKQLRILI